MNSVAEPSGLPETARADRVSMHRFDRETKTRYIHPVGHTDRDRRRAALTDQSNIGLPLKSFTIRGA
jgi:hypothetical protein